MCAPASMYYSFDATYVIGAIIVFVVAAIGPNSSCSMSLMHRTVIGCVTTMGDLAAASLHAKCLPSCQTPWSTCRSCLCVQTVWNLRFVYCSCFFFAGPQKKITCTKYSIPLKIVFTCLQCLWMLLFFFFCCCTKFKTLTLSIIFIPNIHSVVYLQWNLLFFSIEVCTDITLYNPASKRNDHWMCWMSSHW